MTDNAAWLKQFAQFQGRVQQLVAADIHEHGSPHAEREASFADLKEYTVEMAGLAFELYEAVCYIERQIELALAAVHKAKDAFHDDVQWADQDPNGKGHD